MKKILVAGGAGYVGHMLTPQLLAAGYAVVVYDMMWYGNDKMPKENPNLTPETVGKVDEVFKKLQSGEITVAAEQGNLLK